MQNKAYQAGLAMLLAAVLLVPVLFATTFPVMLAFGVAHSHLPGVPAFGYFESLALVWGLRIVAPVLGGGKGKAQA